MKTLYNNIKINYVFTFAKNMNLTQGIWMLYLASRGLSLFEIGTLEAIFHVTSFLMETPTGALADLFGRKMSRITGIFFSIASSILMIVSNCYILFALSFVISALSYNFESGAGEALIFDSLKAEGRENRFIKITGNNEVIYQATQIISLAVGGAIGNFEFLYAYYIAIVLSVLALFVAFLFKEPPTGEQTEHKKQKSFTKSIVKQYGDSFAAVKQNKKLLYLIVFTSMLLAGFTLSFYYIQIAFKQAGLSVLRIGIYLAVSAAISAFGAMVAVKIEAKLGQVRLLKVVPLVMGALYALLFVNEIAVFAFFALSFVETVLFVVSRDYINKLIASDKRATILSFDSMMFSFFMILTFPLFGFISDYIGINTSFLIFGGLLLAFAVINIVRVKKKE